MIEERCKRISVIKEMSNSHIFHLELYCIFALTPTSIKSQVHRIKEQEKSLTFTYKIYL